MNKSLMHSFHCTEDELHSNESIAFPPFLSQDPWKERIIKKYLALRTRLAGAGENRFCVAATTSIHLGRARNNKGVSIIRLRVDVDYS